MISVKRNIKRENSKKKKSDNNNHVSHSVSSHTDTYMLKAKKSYMDSRARRNMSQLNTELQDVQRIMVQNIDDVLQRGQALSGKSGEAQNSQHYFCRDATFATFVGFPTF